MGRPAEERKERAPSSPRIHGVGVDADGRCVHYRTDRDIVAFRFPCCGRFYACHRCHEEGEDHPPERWPRSAFSEGAVLCGVCRDRVSVAEYLDASSSCPHCKASFNPRCRLHHHLYFEVPRPADGG